MQAFHFERVHFFKTEGLCLVGELWVVVLSERIFHLHFPEATVVLE